MLALYSSVMSWPNRRGYTLSWDKLNTVCMLAPRVKIDERAPKKIFIVYKTRSRSIFPRKCLGSAINGLWTDLEPSDIIEGHARRTTSSSHQLCRDTSEAQSMK